MIWILAYWRVLAEAAVTAILAITIGVVIIERDHARANLAIAEQRGAVLQSANDAYAAQIDHQNAAIDRLRAEAIEREKAAIAAIAGASVIAAEYDRRAETIIQAKPGENLCISADALIDKYLEGK